MTKSAIVTGNDSKRAEDAMSSVLTGAANLGVNSNFLVNTDTTDPGVLVALAAPRCEKVSFKSLNW